jgi:hypothetical protein
MEDDLLKKAMLSGSLIFIFLFTMVILAVGWFAGSYFVDFSLKRGTSEDPKAPPLACVSILDPNVHLPAQPKAESEKWSVTSADGFRLVATCFRPQRRGHQWVVLVHGYGRNQQNTWDYAAEYLAHGYTVLTPDLRASGDSEGTYLTMGARESQDMQKWVERIVAVDPEARIVLHGVSMGAATVMLASALPMPDNLRAVIEDCGYTSADAMFAMQLNTLFQLPAFPIMDTVDIVSRQKTGVALSAAAPLTAVPHTRVPMLFIHGDADRLVPYEMMQQLYAASGAPVKEQLTVHGAGHAEAKAADPGSYYQHVFSFADTYTR